MTISGLDGAVSDPVKLGFVVSDIRTVANKQFPGLNHSQLRIFDQTKLVLKPHNKYKA